MMITHKFSTTTLLAAFLLSSVLLQLTGCSTTGKSRYTSDKDGPPLENIDVSKIPDAVPKVEPFSRYGNPESYSALGQRYRVQKSYQGYSEKGIASWYGTKFHNHRTSSGEPYNLLGMTAAHKTLPIPCYARVTNLQNNRQVVVKINDRGPFKENRIIDLSYVAAKKLGITGTGLVHVATIDPTHWETQAPTAIIHQTGQPKLYLQIGAFSMRQNAENLLRAIQPYTSATIAIKEAPFQKQSIYKVRIGPLASVDSSDELHHKLLSHQLGNPLTVIE